MLRNFHHGFDMRLSQAFKISAFGIFLMNDFWTPPPPINFVHGSYMFDMDIIDHVAAALGPVACPSRSSRPRKCLNYPNPWAQRSAPSLS